MIQGKSYDKIISNSMAITGHKNAANVTSQHKHARPQPWLSPIDDFIDDTLIQLQHTKNMFTISIICCSQLQLSAKTKSYMKSLKSL